MKVTDYRLASHKGEFVTMHKKLALAFFLVLIGLLPGFSQAEDFRFEARTDREEVGFGDKLQLVISTTMALGRGGGRAISPPAVGSIPGFDIISTQSSTSTRFVNNVGEAHSQLIYRLVPREPGTAVIPAFSIKGPDGETYTTEPIEITVLPPKSQVTEQDALEDADKSVDNNGFKRMFLVLAVLAVIIAVPLVLAMVTHNDRSVDTADDQFVEDALIVEEIVRSAPAKRVNFAAEVEALKGQYAEVDFEFFENYFELFRKAAVSVNSNITDDMTFDEILAKACEYDNSMAQPTQRLGTDIEMVLYARQKPARSFSAINEEAQAIIDAIS